MTPYPAPTGPLAQDAQAAHADPVVSAAGPAAGSVSVPLDRTQILDATAVVLRAHGYDGTTIRRIAEQLDCAVGSIYRHFRDKRELLDAVCQRRFEAVAQHAELGTPVARCASLYARTVADQPDLYRLMFWLACVGQHANPGPDAQGLPKVIARLVAAWAPQFDLPGSANRFWAQLHGTMMEGMDHDAAMRSLGLVRPQEAAEAKTPEVAASIAVDAAADLAVA